MQSAKNEVYKGESRYRALLESMQPNQQQEDDAELTTEDVYIHNSSNDNQWRITGTSYQCHSVKGDGGERL